MSDPVPVNPPLSVPDINDIRAQRAGRNMKKLSDVHGGEPEALWRGYLYRGSYSVLSGVGGVGKTTVACDLIARASSGRAFPEQAESNQPLKCLILSSEDTEGTFKARIEKAGATLENIRIDDSAPPLAEVQHLISGIDLLFIETLDIHMPSGTNSNDNGMVRQALQPFINGLRKHNTSALCVKHWNKSGSQDMLHRVSGAVAYGAAARAALSISVDATRMRYLTCDKCNLDREPPPLKFSMSDQRIEWMGYDAKAHPGLSPRVADAVEILTEMLAEGPVPHKRILARAREAGVPQYVFNDARVYLRVKTKRIGFQGGSTWELPEMQGDGPPVVDLTNLGEMPAEWDPEG
jgi:hypothetical protein